MLWFRLEWRRQLQVSINSFPCCIDTCKYIELKKYCFRSTLFKIRIWNRKFNFNSSVEVMTLIKKSLPFSAFRNTSPLCKAWFTFFMAQLITSNALPIPVVSATCTFLVFSVSIGSNLIFNPSFDKFLQASGRGCLKLLSTTINLQGCFDNFSSSTWRLFSSIPSKKLKLFSTRSFESRLLWSWNHKVVHKICYTNQKFEKLVLQCL